MALQQVIENDLKNALKNRETAKLNLLRVVIAEATKYNKEASDAEVIKAVKKYIDGAKLCHTEEEIPLLEVYLPAEMSDEQMKDLLLIMLAEQGIQKTDVGTIMKAAKVFLDKDFDGKRVSMILKTL
jgi:uncharacterized protein YqeY